MSDIDLMTEIKADNIIAFNIIYRKYSKLIYKLSYSILKSADESENILQDVFLALWENRKNIEKEDPLKSYLCKIAYNSAITITRKRKVVSKYLEFIKNSTDQFQESPAKRFEDSEIHSILNETINHLPRRQKEILLLHKDEGLKYNEIAARLNISINTIETHMSRAIKTLRRKIVSIQSLFLFLFYILVIEQILY